MIDPGFTPSSSKLDNARTYKIKLPPAETKELDAVYDYLFNELCASWAGRIGHYAYSDDPAQIASNQDGFIYCYHLNYWRITADSKSPFVEAVDAIELIHIVPYINLNKEN